VNERQRDLFLWVWSRRRQPGRAAIGLRGALIGALGGVAFALILAPGASPDIPNYNQWGQLFGGIGNTLKAMVLAVPAFGFLAWLGADRIYAAQERMYQDMLAAGARVPEQKPVMELRDRGPALAVAIAFAVIGGLILALFVAVGAGAL